MAAFTTSMTRVVVLVFLVKVSRPYFSIGPQGVLRKKKKSLETRVSNSAQLALAETIHVCVCIVFL